MMIKRPIFSAISNRSYLYFIGGAFLLSGFSAIVYQVVWQRMLFLLLGIDIYSITVVVTVFMVGLGLGGLLGGIIADRYRKHCLAIFFLAEFLIGLWGYFSYPVIYSLSEWMHYDYRTLKVFLLLFWPTSLMGLTLPMLAVVVVEKGFVVAESVGKLYYFNTLGAAIGSLAVGFLLFHYFDIPTVLHIAAYINFAVCSMGILWKLKIL